MCNVVVGKTMSRTAFPYLLLHSTLVAYAAFNPILAVALSPGAEWHCCGFKEKLAIDPGEGCRKYEMTTERCAVVFEQFEKMKEAWIRENKVGRPNGTDQKNPSQSEKAEPPSLRESKR